MSVYITVTISKFNRYSKDNRNIIYYNIVQNVSFYLLFWFVVVQNVTFSNISDFIKYIGHKMIADKLRTVSRTDYGQLTGVVNRFTGPTFHSLQQINEQAKRLFVFHEK